MRKSKKILAGLLATSMLCSMLPLSALAGGFTSEGDINYVDTDVLEVVVPADSTYSFAMDPQGLTSLIDPDGDGEYDADAAGKIIAPSFAAVNKSSYPIDFVVSAKLSTTATDLVIAEAEEDVQVDGSAYGKNSIFLQLTPVKASGINFDDVDAAADELDFDAFDPDDYSDVSTVLSKTAANVTFRVAAADYVYAYDDEFTYDYEAGSGKAFGFTFTGAVNANPNVSWKAYIGSNAKKVSLSVVYDFAKTTTLDDDEADYIDADAYTCTPGAPSEPGFTAASGSYTVATASNWVIPFGVGESSISGITYTIGTSTTKKTCASADWSYANGKITFVDNDSTASTNIVGYMLNNKGTYKVTVALADATTYTYTLTVE